MHKSMQAAHFEMISRLGEIQFFQRTLRSLIRQMPMLSSLTRQWLLRFLAAQSFSLLLCNFSLAFGANQTLRATLHRTVSTLERIFQKVVRCIRQKTEAETAANT